MSGSSKYILEGGEQDLDTRPRFIVLGVGGGGGNAVEHMVQQGVGGITFVCVNTDKQALDTLSVQRKVQLGPGLGAGGKPEKGRDFAEENIEEIRSLLTGFDMVFITAGMGGGTGTGAAPVVARIAKEMGILTVAVVTTPFIFEGTKRIKNAKEGVHQLSENVDSIITVSNQKLLEMHGGMDLNDARKKVDDILLHAVTGLAQIVKDNNKSTAIMNVDFSDVQSAMSARGHALMGIGRASGEDRARAATIKAINSPLLDGLKLENAKGLLVNIRASKSALEEFGDVADVVSSIVDSQEAEMFYGIVQDESMGDEIQVTVVATGLAVDDRPMSVARNKPLSSAFAIDPAAHTTAISQKRPQEVVETPQPQPAVVPTPQRQGGINVATYLQEHMPKK